MSDISDILNRAQQQASEMYQSSEPLYLTPRGEVVRNNNPAGAYVLCGVGGSIPMALAYELGLVGQETVFQAVAERLPERKAVEPFSVENKAVTMPAAMKRPTKRKRRPEPKEQE